MGLYKDLYCEKNHKVVNFIQKYCEQNGIKIVLKNKLKHGKNREGFKGDVALDGDNIFYHQSLLLMAISEFTVGFGSSAVLEGQALNVPYINFLPTDKEGLLKTSWGTYWNDENAEGCSLSVYPSDDAADTYIAIEEYLESASHYDFNSPHPLHSAFL